MVDPPQSEVSVAEAERLLAEARRKASPSGWRYYHRVLRRQSRVNELIFRTLAELTEVLQGLNAPLRKLEERVGRTLREMQKQQQEELASLRNALNAIQAKLPGPVDGFDELYLDLENKFRGSEEVVRERMLVYLPYLEKIKATIKKMSVLDLGCGRGEWLALLRENDHRAQGVDRNEAMIAKCLSQGLDVYQEDLFIHLRNQGNNSVAVVTAFHVAEHLRFEQLIELIDESFRILKKGGIAIFETPNPESVFASARIFRLDPTHHNPIPPKLFEFLLGARGFASTEILHLQPVPQAAQFTSENAPNLARTLNQLFYGTQDYGIIARKA